MKKRYEPIPPDPDLVRPVDPPEEGQKSENDFALRLAASLRAEKQAHEAAAPQRPKPLDLFPTRDTPSEDSAGTEAAPHTPVFEPLPLPEDLEAELNELLGREPDPPAPEPAEAEQAEAEASEPPAPYTPWSARVTTSFQSEAAAQKLWNL